MSPKQTGNKLLESKPHKVFSLENNTKPRGHMFLVRNEVAGVFSLSLFGKEVGQTYFQGNFNN
jgi:hypothetical protein